MKAAIRLKLPSWFLAAISLSYSTALSPATPDTPANKEYAKIKPSGKFVLVEKRRASYVAAPIDIETQEQKIEPKTVNIGKMLKWHNGTVCSKWELKPNHIYCAFLEDPLLTDTQVKSKRNGSTSYLVNQGYEVLCEGVSIGSLTDIDGHTLVVPMNNSTINGIFERPISQEIMDEMVHALKRLKYTSKTPDKISQDEFRDAISSYVSDMRGFNIKFYRSPITMTVLDELIERPELRRQLGLDMPE